MRVSTNNKYHNGTVSSYRIVIGSNQAKALGLVDESGNGLQIIPIKTQNGILVIPVEKPLYTLEYKGLQTSVYSYGSIYCGEIADGRRCVSWFAKSADKIESAFQGTAEKFLSE